MRQNYGGFVRRAPSEHTEACAGNKELIEPGEAEQGRAESGLGQSRAALTQPGLYSPVDSASTFNPRPAPLAPNQHSLRAW